MTAYKNGLATWQSVPTFEQLPNVPGIVAVISTNTQRDVLFVTHWVSLRQAENVECEFGNLVNLLSTVLPDFRVSYWVCPPDN